MIDQLQAFPAIAWDFDETLIDHPNSPLFHEFILAHPDKRHCIVTFRTHGWQRTIFREMAMKYPDAPKRDAFDLVFNIEDHAWEEFEKVAVLRRTGDYDGPLTTWEMYYIEWKGLTAHENDLPVLIDDRREQVILGCEKYRVAYFHPDELSG